MNLVEAKKLLGSSYKEDGSIYHGLDSLNQSLWRPGNYLITLNGNWSPEELKAIVYVMELKGKENDR